MEQEVLKTVLQEMLLELSSQKDRIAALQIEREVTRKACLRMEEKLAETVPSSCRLSAEQEQVLKETIRTGFDHSKGELIKHPAVSHTYRNLHLLLLSFRMEYFPLLVNTIMKWVVVLIILIFTIWMVASLSR